MATAGISGIGVAVAAAGGFLLYAGIRDVEILTGLREITQGKVPTPRAPRPSRLTGGGAGGGGGGGGGGDTTSPAGGTHPEIAREALKHVGAPYVFGTAGPDRFDCSGLVKYVFKQLGYGSLPHSAAAQVALPMFRKVSRSECGAGDLVWWPGHIGIAVDNRMGVFAPQPGQSVQVTPIDVSGPRKGAPTLCVRYVGKGE